MDRRGPLRILQVLATTDADDVGLAALDLHAALSRHGEAVRSVALGPGWRGGLDGLLPVLGPSTRALSARTQLRRERRWADVVLLQGPTAVEAAASRLLGGGPPAVAALDPGSFGSVAEALPATVRAVVVTTIDVSPPARDHLPAAPVVAVPMAVDVGAPPTTPAARAEARRLRGLPQDVAVVRLLDEGANPEAVGDWSAAVAAAGMVRLEPSDDVEVDLAATDVVAWPGSTDLALPPRALLTSAAAGAAVVVGRCGATTGLLEGAVLVVEAADDLSEALESLRDPEGRGVRGAGAAELVRRDHDIDATAGAWVSALADVVG